MIEASSDSDKDRLADEVIDRCIRISKEEERVHQNFVLSKKGRKVLWHKVRGRMDDPMFPAMIERDIAIIMAAFLTGFQYGFDAGKGIE
jgi:hypothetical protein